MLSRRMILLGLLLALLAGGMLASGQGDVSWRVESASPLPLPEGVRTIYLYPAPDGRQVAYEKQVGEFDWLLCVMDVFTNEERCFDHPTASESPMYYYGWTGLFPTPLAWSPDGARLAVTGQPFNDPFFDIDPVVIDLASGSATTYFDDGFEGGIFSPGAANVNISLLMTPTWSPDGREIAFVQIPAGKLAESFLPSIVILDVDSGITRDLGPLPGPRVSGLAWSPDGMTLAVIFEHDDEETGGLWLIDVESGEAAQAYSPDMAQTGLLSFYPEYVDLADSAVIIPYNPLRWSPDGRRLLYKVIDVTRLVPSWFFWLDLNVAQAFTTEFAPPPYFDESTSTHAWMFTTLWLAWSPDGGTLLVAGNESPPPGPEDVIPLHETMATDGPYFQTVYLLDVETRTTVLWGHMPDAAFHTAVWGPDGDVILNGYHLQLAQE